MGSRIANPHFPSAPLRMADGRLFTDYRPSCTLLAPPTPERRAQMIQGGVTSMALDRYNTVNRAGQHGVVDTMVPELHKSVYSWDGGVRAMAHPVGIGLGRMYVSSVVPSADPDVVAVATFPQMGGTYPAYVEGVTAAPAPVATVRRNRYSAPHA
jgi:hypothetical protein